LRGFEFQHEQLWLRPLYHTLLRASKILQLNSTLAPEGMPFIGFQGFLFPNQPPISSFALPIAFWACSEATDPVLCAVSPIDFA
jgi:hypothetical protein